MIVLALLACGKNADAVRELEIELALRQERVEALEKELEACQDGGETDREARLENLQKTLDARRAARGRTEDAADAPVVLPWEGPPTLRTFMAAPGAVDDASRLGRVLPHRGPDGEFDGMRLSAIRRGSLLDRLGFRNGDILHAVNGQPLDSLTSSMKAYNSLSNQAELKKLEASVTRRGVPMTVSIDLDAPIAEMVGAAGDAR